MGAAEEILLLGHVGPAKLYDGSHGMPFRQGNQGEFVTSDMNGFFFEQVMRGNGFVFSNAAAGVAPVAATTTNAPVIWNPAGSNRNLVLIKVVASLAATGTVVTGSIVYGTLTQVGSQVGTAAPFTSGTFVAGVSLLVGSGITSLMKFAPVTCVTVGTPTLLAPSSFGQAAAPTTVQPSIALTDWIYGAIIIPPGNTFNIMASGSIASTYCFGIYALELPIFVP